MQRFRKKPFIAAELNCKSYYKTAKDYLVYDVIASRRGLYFEVSWVGGHYSLLSSHI
jgi:hypothetical protein